MGLRFDANGKPYYPVIVINKRTGLRVEGFSWRERDTEWAQEFADTLNKASGTTFWEVSRAESWRGQE